ncbi:MAG: dihydroorotate dehydrogenase [Christensenellales bacterium]
MIDLSVSLGDIKLDNPVIPASGTFGYGLEFAELYDINILGSFSIKGTTSAERFGNPLPRIAETPSGMLNSVGLQNPGAEAVVNEYFPKLKKVYRKKVFANVGGHDVVSYMKAAEILSRDDIVCALELNISCPNVKEGGMAFGTDPVKAAEITAAVKSVSEKPVFVKLSPNVTSVVDVAIAVAAAGADGITLINTLLGMAVDRKTGRAITAVPHAGLSGAAVKPVALRMVHEVAGVVDLPIIGMGGIESAWDVIEFMSVGASAVMVGSKNLTDPFICKKIIEELPGVLNEIGVSDIKSIIGRTDRCAR